MLRFFFILFFVLFATSSFSSSNEDFDSWLIKFKKDAIKKGISEKTKLTVNFMKRKMNEFDELKKELESKK